MNTYLYSNKLLSHKILSHNYKCFVKICGYKNNRYLKPKFNAHGLMMMKISLSLYAMIIFLTVCLSNFGLLNYIFCIRKRPDTMVKCNKML